MVRRQLNSLKLFVVGVLAATTLALIALPQVMFQHDAWTDEERLRVSVGEPFSVASARSYTVSVTGGGVIASRVAEAKRNGAFALMNAGGDRLELNVVSDPTDGHLFTFGVGDGATPAEASLRFVVGTDSRLDGVEFVISRDADIFHGRILAAMRWAVPTGLTAVVLVAHARRTDGRRRRSAMESVPC